MTSQDTNTGPISVTVVNSGQEFLDKAGDFLYENEAANNTILSVSALADKNQGLIGPPFWFGVADHDGTVVGCAIHAMPDGLCVPEMGVEAANTLSLAFAQSGHVPQRICGIEAPTRMAAKTLTAATNTEYKINNIWVGATARKAKRPTVIAPGTLRLAKPEEADEIRELGRQYGEEKPTLLDVSAYFLRKMHDGMLWVWEHNGIRTAIAMGGSSHGGVRVSGVFTPKGDRGKGYASTAVWAVTRHYLKQTYQFATLVVEKQEPALMKMYQKLGYELCKTHVELKAVA